MRARARQSEGAGVSDASVSLVDELDALADVIDSAQLVTELLANGGLPDGEAVARAPRMLEAVLAVASSRLRLLRKVILRQADPGLLRGRRNARQPPVQKWEDPDLLLDDAPRRKGR